MKRFYGFVVLPVFFFALFSIDVFSQSNTRVKPATEIKVCKVELTEAGRTANFHFNYIYLLTTDRDGVVEGFEPLHQDKTEDFVLITNEEEKIKIIL